MVTTHDRSTPKHLARGDKILVTKNGTFIKVAEKRTGSIVATLLASPEPQAAPVKGKRGGYRLRTDLGLIDWVAAVRGIWLASPGDIKRAGRVAASRDEARSEALGQLSGIELPPDRQTVDPLEPKPVAAAKRPATGTLKPVSRPALPPVPTPSEVAASVRAASALNGAAKIPTPKGKSAAANFRAMANASVNERARDFWMSRAAAAEAPA